VAAGLLAGTAPVVAAARASTGAHDTMVPLRSPGRAGAPAMLQDTAAVRVIGTIEVGTQPHGIRFSASGDSAFVALPGESAIAVIDVAAMRVARRFPAGRNPLDMVPLAAGEWLVSEFGAETLATTGATPDRRWRVGGGPSLFAPRIIDGRAYISSEFADTLTIFDVRKQKIVSRHTTGDRPYPPAVTSDGSLVFVPNRNDGSVTVIDALNGATVRTVAVCGQPYGGAVTPDDVNYVVACAAPPRVVYVNTASFEPVAAVTRGFERRPFSVAFSADGRWGLVNNAGASTVSVLDVRARRVVDRIEVGPQPIAVRVHPDGRRAFVASELAGTITVIDLPPVPERPIEPRNEVIVLGMIHGQHRTSERYGLDVLRRLLREIRPDYALTEIPPNRFEVAKAEFEQTGGISEPRVRVFPEYVDVMFPLTRELPFEIVPTAAWNAYMNSYRSAVLSKLPDDPTRAEDWAVYQEALAKRDSTLAAEGADDDPRFIHSDRYDDIMEIAYEPFDRLFNDDLGPGGWGNINRGHMSHINRVLDEHRGEGKRFVITYGAGHKGWILRELRKRDDIAVLDAGPFLDRIGVPRQ
jgi:YVTN family beta-propeller protein